MRTRYVQKLTEVMPRRAADAALTEAANNDTNNNFIIFLLLMDCKFGTTYIAANTLLSSLCHENRNGDATLGFYSPGNWLTVASPSPRRYRAHNSQYKYNILNSSSQLS